MDAIPLPRNRGQRWIKIGAVRYGWFVYECSHGSPNGFYLLWAGRTVWCQPFQFRVWDRLMSAVEHRLKLSHLRMMAVAHRLPRDHGQQNLWVLVERIGKRLTIHEKDVSKPLCESSEFS